MKIIVAIYLSFQFLQIQFLFMFPREISLVNFSYKNRHFLHFLLFWRGINITCHIIHSNFKLCRQRSNIRSLWFSWKLQLERCNGKFIRVLHMECIWIFSQHNKFKILFKHIWFWISGPLLILLKILRVTSVKWYDFIFHN